MLAVANDQLQNAANAATSISAGFVLLGLAIAAIQLIRGARAAEGALWMQYRESFAIYDEIHRLVMGRQSLTDEQIARCLGYMGLLEHGEHLLKARVLNPKVFKDIYGYRVKLLVQSRQIMFWTLYLGDWSTFRQLIDRLGLSHELQDTMESLDEWVADVSSVPARENPRTLS